MGTFETGSGSPDSTIAARSVASQMREFGAKEEGARSLREEEEEEEEKEGVEE